MVLISKTTYLFPWDWREFFFQGGGLVYTKADVSRVFTYHAPSEEQVAKMIALRSAARVLADLIVTHVRVCADQTVAFRKLREAIMYANAGIVIPAPEDATVPLSGEKPQTG